MNAYLRGIKQMPELATRLRVLAGAGNRDAKAAMLYWDTPWFARSPHDIIADMGYTLEQGKINNLVSFASGSIDLWSYLSIIPHEHRSALGDEWANFLLGPLAAALKLQKLGFEDREQVLHTGGAIVITSDGRSVLERIQSENLLPPPTA